MVFTKLSESLMKWQLGEFTPAWGKLCAVFSSTLYDRTFVSIFGVFGFIVGLRIRLIGDSDPITKLIRGDGLVISGVFLMASGIIWKLSEAIHIFTVPDDIRETPTLYKYIDQMKKGVFNDEYFKSSFDEHINKWNEINIAPKTSVIRFIIFLGTMLSLLLCLLSLVVLAASSGSFLRATYHCLTQSDSLSCRSMH